ncbi:acyl-CoA synthetase [Verminephrobacter eiseniae]|uniref:AMP-binding protein n=1 Tax=Verminephrobacter eiseniae TaxID=364317 RepID=UPI0022385129|nr:AMP-binding protein [Verminephrobacter eiseniae]MCW5259563.1 acyl-CoA synthetase [Verminephrobacter eiseniae]
MNPHDDPLAQDPLLRELAELQQRHWPAAIARKPAYPFGELALSEYLRRWAALQPQKAAVIFYGQTITYAQLDALSERCAALLASHGVQAGERVAVMLPNCPQYHIVFFAILKLGAVHVPVNPLFKAQELLYELNDSGAKTLVVLDQLAEMAGRVLPRTSVTTGFFTSMHDMLPAAPTLPVPPSILGPRIAPAGMLDLMPALHAGTQQAPQPSQLSQPSQPPQWTRRTPELDAPAALNYTGGTTGMPKGCVHTQRDMIYTAATTCSVAHQIGPDDITLNYMALFWIAGENAGMIFPIFSGSTVVLLARWDPVGAMAAIERYGITRAGMVLDNAVEIMEHPQAGAYDLRSLKAVRVSSFVKKLNPEYRRRWRQLTGTVMIEAAWGMTETHTCDTFTTGQQDDDLDLRGQPVFVGLPVPGTVIKICSFQTGATLPIGQEGEIVVRSPSLLKAYWNKAEATTESLRGGWLHTGDIGVFDARGCLHFLGRAKEMLKVKGMSVFPSEVEALLGRHPEVLGCGVVGQADAEKGEIPIAFVRLRDASALTEADLAAWCRDNMAGYKVPQIRLVSALPMTATGKVKKHELQALLQ